MLEDLSGKTALVTGAGKRSGIGFGIARSLAAHGCHVVIADLGAQVADLAVPAGTLDEMTSIAEELARDHGVRTRAVCLDVTDPAGIDAALAVVAEFGGLDVLVNNAGASFGVPNLVHMYDEAAWMRTLDVNLHGVFRVSRAALPLMFGRPASIVNIASRAGKVPPTWNGAYAVAKAGVIMLTKVMAKELGAMGVRVNAVCPGQIHTDLEAWRFSLEAQAYGGTTEEREAAMVATIPVGRMGLPADVANLVTFLASEASSYMTGQALNITGGQLMEA
jgi:NAD(P)-dependent dehydrogenase (short-subunit alcohol dehydrogenase family)